MDKSLGASEEGTDAYGSLELSTTYGMTLSEKGSVKASVQKLRSIAEQRRLAISNRLRCAHNPVSRRIQKVLVKEFSYPVSSCVLY